jgi:pimeloyl-ACP methyl ester carboxylesterase
MPRGLTAVDVQRRCEAPVKLDVPVLIVHGTEDRILPFAATAARLPALIGAGAERFRTYPNVNE